MQNSVNGCLILCLSTCCLALDLDCSPSNRHAQVKHPCKRLLGAYGVGSGAQRDSEHVAQAHAVGVHSS